MHGNRKEIKLGEIKFLVVDLTEPLKEITEVYPGDPKPKKQVFSDIIETSFQHHIYELGDHNFHPHGDAQKHQNPDSQHKGFECFDLETTPVRIVGATGGPVVAYAFIKL